MPTQVPGSPRRVSLKALEAAITQVESLRDLEHTCEVSGVVITLRPLRPEQETEVQRYAQLAWESGDKQNLAEYADFMDRMRHSCLSHALVQIGDLDLREVEYVESGETDEHGNLVSLPKSEVLLNLVRGEWGRPMLSKVFEQYGVLLDKVAVRATNATRFDPVDNDAEIERLERRLVDLRAAKELALNPPEDLIQKRQRAVLNAQAPLKTPENIPRRDVTADVEVIADDALGHRVPEAPEATPEPTSGRRSAAPPMAPPSPSGRRSAVPATASAPSAPVREAEEVRLSSDLDAPQPPTAPAPVEDPEWPGIPSPHAGDSFFDPSDPDAAMAQETQRQAAFHRQNLQEGRRRQQEQEAQAKARAEAGLPDPRTATAQQRSEPPRGSVRLDSRTEGLRAAANVNDAVLDAGAGRVRSGRSVAQPTPGTSPGAPAKLHGHPVYEMPAQVLAQSSREHARETAQPIPAINPEGGSRNPRFKGPQGSQG